MIVGPRNAQTADRYHVAVAFRAVVGDRWAEFRPLEKEGEGSLAGLSQFFAVLNFFSRRPS